MSTVSMAETGATAAAGVLLPRPFRIERVRRDTKDTFTLELAPADGGSALEFTAGQFNMIYVFGVGEVPISISGDPGKPARLVHTIRAVGTVTRALARLGRGGILGVRGPFGSDWGVKEAAGSDLILVAGGIGLAPLRPVLYELLAHRTRFGRVVLLYGARTPADALYAKELERWRSRFDLEVEVTVDVATGGWRGNVGLVTSLIPRAPLDPANTVAMVCGPEVMMRFVVQDLRERGVPAERIRLSMERNMKCAIGHCGHCQFGPEFICKDGPVLRYSRIQYWFGKPEI